MNSEQVIDYRKSIKFELIRAKLAFEEFYGYAGGFIKEEFDDSNVLAKVKIFDAYARWIGHLYESLLALVKIEKCNSVTKNSKFDVTDPQIQLEAKKSWHRFSALVQSGQLEAGGHIEFTLDSQFAEDLRQARNQCSFHCTSNRIQSQILQNFMIKHHHMAYFLYSEILDIHGNLDCDLGAIDKFFSISRSTLLPDQY